MKGSQNQSFAAQSPGQSETHSWVAFWRQKTPQGVRLHPECPPCALLQCVCCRWGWCTCLEIPVENTGTWGQGVVGTLSDDPTASGRVVGSSIRLFEGHQPCPLTLRQEDLCSKPCPHFWQGSKLLRPLVEEVGRTAEDKGGVQRVLPMEKGILQRGWKGKSAISFHWSVLTTPMQNNSKIRDQGHGKHNAKCLKRSQNSLRILALFLPWSPHHKLWKDLGTCCQELEQLAKVSW